MKFSIKDFFGKTSLIVHWKSLKLRIINTSALELYTNSLKQLFL